MTTQDLTANRDRIIRKINSQITKATNDNIKAVMTKMIAMLPLFANEKATMANIDKLTMKDNKKELDKIFNEKLMFY